MKIEAGREGGSALLQLEGRLDREGAERLSDTLEDLLHDGVRSLRIDFSRVTYASSAATKVLSRCQQELTVLRGEVLLTSLSPAVSEVFAAAGWDSGVPGADPAAGPIELRRSSWHSRSDLAASGQYDLSSGVSNATLTCHLHGDPGRTTRASIEPDDWSVVSLPEGVFGLGLGAIGGQTDSNERLGELIAVAGCVAYFPTDGARMADYLVGSSQVVPRATMMTGLTCEGDFSQLVRFSPKPEAGAVPLSELAAIALDAAGRKTAGVVIAAETAGLCGARLRRSPARGVAPLRFDVPDVREWLSFAPERTWSITTTLIAGVVARAPQGPLAAHLRPLDATGELRGHLHAAVFSYHPLPQRTVELTALVKGLFADHQLRDVLHLLYDDRGDAAVGESVLVRGVGWVAPIAQVG